MDSENRRTVMLAALLTATLAIAPLASIAQTAIPGFISAAIAADRPAADVARDAARKPAELIAFAGIEPGDRVADLMPGGGYFTRIFSRIVTRKGQVFAVVPSEFAESYPDAPKAAHALARDPALSINVVAIVTPSTELAMPEQVDVAWTADNYHDLYGEYGAAKAAAFAAAVYKAVKPGGVFIVIDHVALPGSSDSAPKTLHRIDPETVKAQVLAAGFVLEAESSVLRNPDDPHDVAVFVPALRGHSDQFVFKFRKPVR